jgi:hypothetical protein
MSLRQIAAAMLISTAAIVVPAANAQMTQVSVKVDDKDYTVTEMRGSRAGQGHMVQLAGPEGAAMVMVDNNNKITAYISPPGGGGKQDLINKVWAAYLEKKTGTAPVGSTPASETADPNSARRADIAARAAAITAQVQGRGNGPSAVGSTERSVIGANDAGEIVVHDPALGASGGADVTISRDGMKATWVIAANGMPPVKMTAEFEGGDQPASAGAKALKGAKGVGSAVLYSYSPGVVTNVSADPDHDWRIVSEGSNGKNTTELGGYRLNQVRDSGKVIAEKQLEAVKQDVLAAQGYKDSDGHQVVVLTSDRSQRGLTALDEITKAYGDPKP